MTHIDGVVVAYSERHVPPLQHSQSTKIQLTFEHFWPVMDHLKTHTAAVICHSKENVLHQYTVLDQP